MRSLAIALALSCVVSCTHGGGGSSAPPNVAGMWVGQWHIDAAPEQLRIVLAQTGTSVTGTIEMATVPAQPMTAVGEIGSGRTFTLHASSPGLNWTAEFLCEAGGATSVPTQIAGTFSTTSNAHGDFHVAPFPPPFAAEDSEPHGTVLTIERINADPIVDIYTLHRR